MINSQIPPDTVVGSGSVLIGCDVIVSEHLLPTVQKYRPVHTYVHMYSRNFAIYCRLYKIMCVQLHVVNYPFEWSTDPRCCSKVLCYNHKMLSLRI